MKEKLAIFDLPFSQGQVHIHGDASSGRVYDYSQKYYIPLNAYESAMVDLRAKQLGLSKIVKPIKMKM